MTRTLATFARCSCALLIAPLPACGTDAERDDIVVTTAPGADVEASASDATSSVDPPRPTTSGELCIIAADCPAGTHCDLGECIQSCSTEAPCGAGNVCSERGRCIPEGAEDRDPAPVTTHAGAVSATPIAAELSELDDTLTVELSSDADDLVRYRVELRAPFLRMEGAERGEFAGSTRLHFRVLANAAQGTLTTGTIVVHTTLGDVTLHPSLRVGLTGRYQGVLRYSSGSTPLGDVSIAVDMLDDNGDVLMRVDPERSMTFPAVQGNAATGRGVFTFSDGLSVSVAQVFSADFGHDRNHFKRPLGRRVAFELAPIGRGRLEGTFTENVYGILEQPIVLTGSVYLEPVSSEAPASFDIAEPPPMPSVARGSYPAISLFRGWTESSCMGGACDSRQSLVDRLSCIENTIEPTYYERLRDSLDGVRTGADPFDAIARDCETELAVATPDEYDAAPRRCALLPPLACGLNFIAQNEWRSQELPTARAAYNRLFARVLSPALLVAQNHVVQALKDSFTAGVSAQAERFRQAREVLRAPATFLLASGPLEYLRALPSAFARGDSTSSDPTETRFPAARALARLIYVLHTLDAEEGRSAAADRMRPLTLAQERGVLGFFEAAMLAAVLESWGNPPNVGNEFVGTLTLADRGFSALAQGALVFGVPEGEVAMVYDPARPQPTNFEQLLELKARPALEQFAADQETFQAASRQFELNASALQSELEGVRRSYDDQIRAICGDELALDAVPSDADWATCGAGGNGELAQLTLDIQQSQLRVEAAHSRLNGMSEKYRIDEQRLASTQGIRREQLFFIAQTGHALEGLIVQEGLVNVAQAVLTMSAHADFWNGGAPLGMAVAQGILEGMRTQIHVARQTLLTAQEMRAVVDANKIELVNGMAELQKQLIDMAQLELELAQDALAVVQADLRRRNLLDTAKRIFAERLRALARIEQSPLDDPTYRVLQDRRALQVVRSRGEAQRWLYRAARALEYEVNTPLGESLSRAVLGAYNVDEAQRLARCLSSIHADYTAEFGVPQEFTTDVSVREMLGFLGTRTDEVTGAVLEPGELFRQSLLRNENIDRHGNLHITFSTNLQPDNGLWSTNVCDDKITRVQAQIVGDFQGDDQAEIQVALEGGSVLRRCDSEALNNWNLETANSAVVQAGVNTFGQAPPNTSLFGQSVARPSWHVVIPSGSSAPANADLDFEHLEDIVLRITHKALPRVDRSLPVDVSCLGTVGAGG